MPSTTFKTPSNLPPLGHVNLMIDTLIANASLEDLQAMIRTMLSHNPTMVSAFVSAARICLSQATGRTLSAISVVADAARQCVAGADDVKQPKPQRLREEASPGLTRLLFEQRVFVRSKSGLIPFDNTSGLAFERCPFFRAHVQRLHSHYPIRSHNHYDDHFQADHENPHSRYFDGQACQLNLKGDGSACSCPGTNLSRQAADPDAACIGAGNSIIATLLTLQNSPISSSPPTVPSPVSVTTDYDARTCSSSDTAVTSPTTTISNSDHFDTDAEMVTLVVPSKLLDKLMSYARMLYGSGMAFDSLEILTRIVWAVSNLRWVDGKLVVPSDAFLSDKGEYQDNVGNFEADHSDGFITDEEEHVSRFDEDEYFDDVDNNDDPMTTTLAFIDSDIAQALQSCREQMLNDPAFRTYSSQNPSKYLDSETPTDAYSHARSTLKALEEALEACREAVATEWGGREFPFERGVMGMVGLRI